MTPPALIIAGGAVIAVGSIVAFHQFVYEPHIAPKLEIFVENWLEQRRLKRRQLTRRVSIGDDGDVPSGSRATSQLELDTISVPLRVTSIDAGLSESTLRRRSNATGGQNSFVLESPNVFIPFGTLTPLSNADPLPGGPALSSPRLSTPSTVSSSLLDLQSSSRAISPAARSTSDHSRRSSTDSILADANNHLSFATLSPVHSVTHISPRALLVTISQPTHVDEDSRPLDEFTRARRQSAAHSPTQSPMGSTIYESFAPSDRSISPALPEGSTARTLLFPPNPRGPRSTTSWSEVADSDEDPEFLVGSDVESWASVSDRPVRG